MNTNQTNPDSSTSKTTTFFSRWGLSVAIAGFTIGVVSMYFIIAEQRSVTRSYEFYEFEYRSIQRRFSEEISDLENRVRDLEIEISELNSLVAQQKDMITALSTRLGQ